MEILLGILGIIIVLFIGLAFGILLIKYALLFIQKGD